MRNTSLADLDDDTLAGHLLLAGIDQRFADHQALAEECERRGILKPGEQQRMRGRLRQRARNSELPGPILAGPED